MNTEILGLFFPIAFALHNAEEYRSFQDFKDFYLKKINAKFHHRTVFLYAIIFLTLLVSGFCVLNYLRPNQVYQHATTIVAISFLINGVQHCVSSLWVRKILPGTISSFFLLIPCASIYLMVFEREKQFGWFNIIEWVAISGIVMFLSIRVSLWIGYLFFRFQRKK